MKRYSVHNQLNHSKTCVIYSLSNPLVKNSEAAMNHLLNNIIWDGTPDIGDFIRWVVEETAERQIENI